MAKAPKEKYCKSRLPGITLRFNLKKGNHKKVYEVLPFYDAYVMCSYIEGFGVSAAEAMAIGLCFYCRISTCYEKFRKEMHYFLIRLILKSFAKIINSIFNESSNLKFLSDKAKEIAKDNYTKEIYLQSLFKVYDRLLNHTNSN